MILPLCNIISSFIWEWINLYVIRVGSNFAWWGKISIGKCIRNVDRTSSKLGEKRWTVKLKQTLYFILTILTLYVLTIFLTYSQSLLTVSSMITQTLITCLLRLMSTFSGSFDTKLSSCLINLHVCGSTVLTQTIVTIPRSRRPLKTGMQQTLSLLRGFQQSCIKESRLLPRCTARVTSHWLERIMQPSCLRGPTQKWKLSFYSKDSEFNTETMYWAFAVLVLSQTRGKAEHLSMFLARIITKKKLQDRISAIERVRCQNNICRALIILTNESS